MRPFFIYLLKFVVIFSVLYGVSWSAIGLSTPENRYSPFIANYFNYVQWLTTGMMKAVAAMSEFIGYKSFVSMPNYVGILRGATVIVGYDCVGIGVYSFWTALIAASGIDVKSKAGWIFGGLLFFWLLNVYRIFLVLMSTQLHWHAPLGIDHHTWFNLVVYTFMIAGIIWLMKLYQGRFFKWS